jgi:large subunit ribosomal protein L25
MKQISLTASARQDTGKGAARRVRAKGMIPGIVYGPAITPINISVTEADLRTAMRAQSGGISIFDLDVEGLKQKVLLRDVQRDPVTSHVVHIDFHAISMDKPISISVPINFIGTPIGLKEGGIQQVTMRELDISCLPTNIPEHVEVDVSNLAIGDSIHVRDMQIPNVEILVEGRRTVVVISSPTVVKSAAEEAAEVAAAEEAAAAVAAEGEEKKEEE